VFPVNEVNLVPKINLPCPGMLLKTPMLKEVYVSVSEKSEKSNSVCPPHETPVKKLISQSGALVFKPIKKFKLK